MEQTISKREEKLINMLKYAPIGLAEIDTEGTVLDMNLKSLELLTPLSKLYNTELSNLFPLLNLIKPDIAASILNFTDETGITFNDIISVDLGSEYRYFNIMSNKQVDGTIMLSFDDITERQIREAAIRQMELEKAVSQGKFEIASGVLHDIGNAVVGFGSYLTRTKRLLEQSSCNNIASLVIFFEHNQDKLASVLGKEKAQALVDLLAGIHKAQVESEGEISKSVTEQLNIIAHIQEILNIQRQYVSGHGTQERKSVNIRGLINDCLAMLFASFDKRGIAVSINAPDDTIVVSGDRTKLMQVLLNILKNSLEAIDISARDKSIIIDLATDTNHISLTITDSGVGFDDIIRAKLFERGFTTKSTGSGLGLYNCKTIIESHSATIDINSKGVGKGTSTIIKFNKTITNI